VYNFGEYDVAQVARISQPRRSNFLVCFGNSEEWIKCAFEQHSFCRLEIFRAPEVGIYRVAEFAGEFEEQGVGDFSAVVLLKRCEGRALFFS
jgi:hypothetical protein